MNGNWISVKDRLPDGVGDYMVFHYGDVVTAFCNYEKKWHINGVCAEKVTYWMFLPEPPDKI